MPRQYAGAKKFLKITGYDGANQIFHKVVPLHRRSDASIISLLQRLACRGLDEEDIIDASLSKKTAGYRSILEPMTSRAPGHRASISVGVGISYEASVWRGDELAQDQVRR